MKKFLALLLICSLFLPSPALIEEAYTAEDILISGDGHEIPATLTLPTGKGPFPAVIMLHGNGSNRHEAGNAYDYFAPELAKAGIASLRFDYIGNGDSKEDYIDFTYDKAIADAMACYAYLKGSGNIDMEKVAIMGWSQGGRLALLTAARNPVFTTVLTWAGALDQKSGEEEQYEIAKKDGYYEVTYAWRPPLRQSPAYYENALSIDYAAELAKIEVPVLAINGALDDVVLPEVAERIAAGVQNKDSKALLLENADHTFNVFSGDLSTLHKLSGESIAWFTAQFAK